MQGMEMSEAARIFDAWRLAEEPEPITQETIARRLDVSLSTVRRWSRGDGAPKLGQIRALEAMRPGLLAMLVPEAFTSEG